jgi:hypothetical protein
MNGEGEEGSLNPNAKPFDNKNAMKHNFRDPL